jgi:hypothetical protein
MSEKKKDVIRSYGFGSLLLFHKCFVPKKFSKWLASHVECKSGDLLICGKVISLTAETVNLVIGIPVGGTPFPSNYSNGRSIVLSKIDKSSLPQISFFAEKLNAVYVTDEQVLICFLVVALHCFLCPNSNIVPSPRYLGVLKTFRIFVLMTGLGLCCVGCLMVLRVSIEERKMVRKVWLLLVVICST